MMRLLVLSALVALTVIAWTMALPEGSNSGVSSPQAGGLSSSDDKSSKLVENSHRRVPKRSNVQGEKAGNRSVDLAEGDHDSVLLALRREVSRLKAEVADLRRDVKKLLEPDEFAATDGDFFADEQKPLAVRQAEELAAREESEWQLRQYMTAIEDRFQSEHDHAGWSVQVAEIIERELQREIFSETRLISLECRSSICRLEVQHDNPQASSVFTNEYPEKVAEVFSKFSIDHLAEGDSYSSMVIYLMQEEPG